MQVATVRDLIKALQKFSMDAPVFGYSDVDEGDFPIQVVSLNKPHLYENQYYPAFGCQGDSYVEEYWSEKGVPCEVVYVRPRMYCDIKKGE